MIYVLRCLCFSVIAVVVLLLGGCGDDDDIIGGGGGGIIGGGGGGGGIIEPPPPPKNNPPVIEQIIFPERVTGKDTVQFKVVARDADGDALNYTWEFIGTDGVIDEINSSGVWNVPNRPGTATVQINVSDGKRTVTSEVKVTVIKKPDPITVTKHFRVTGAKIPIWQRNFWEDWSNTLTYPGEILNWSWRSENPSGDAKVTKGAEVISGNNITLKGRILAKTFPLSILDVWVTVTYQP